MARIMNPNANPAYLPNVPGESVVLCGSPVQRRPENRTVVTAGAMHDRNESLLDHINEDKQRGMLRSSCNAYDNDSIGAV